MAESRLRRREWAGGAGASGIAAARVCSSNCRTDSTEIRYWGRLELLEATLKARSSPERMKFSTLSTQTPHRRAKSRGRKQSAVPRRFRGDRGVTTTSVVVEMGCEATDAGVPAGTPRSGGSKHATTGWSS